MVYVNFIRLLLNSSFPKIDKLERPNAPSPYDGVVTWFFEGSGFELLDDVSDEDYKKTLNDIKPLEDLIQKHQADINKEDAYFLKEFLLWGLVEFKKLSKHRFTEGYQFKDPYGSYISGL